MESMLEMLETIWVSFMQSCVYLLFSTSAVSLYVKFTDSLLLQAVSVYFAPTSNTLNTLLLLCALNCWRRIYKMKKAGQIVLIWFLDYFTGENVAAFSTSVLHAWDNWNTESIKFLSFMLTNINSLFSFRCCNMQNKIIRVEPLHSSVSLGFL